MEPEIKLARKLGDARLAEKLVGAGFDTEGKIEAAEDKDIEAAVGKGGLAKVRNAFPKVK